MTEKDIEHLIAQHGKQEVLDMADRLERLVGDMDSRGAKKAMGLVRLMRRLAQGEPAQAPPKNQQG